MISVLDAREIIFENIRTLGTEVVCLGDGFGRVLSRPFFATRDVPPVDNSAMDGFAVRAAAAAGASERNIVRLPIVRSIRAGDRAGQPVGDHEAVRIMTGAPVPKGADAVIPVEDTVVEKEVLLLSRAARKGDHIRLAGEDIRSGQQILPAGRPLRAADLGLIASQGAAQIQVHRRPEVAILGTGDEVVELGEVPHEAQIFGSNCHTLSALVRECGGIPRQLGIARDDPGVLSSKLQDGLESDILITTGSVSMGDFDYLKDVFREFGVKILFWKVAQKPGKPLTFGTWNGKPVFALPGNPVSAALGFELYVRPALRRMMGHDRLFRPSVWAILAEDIRKKPGRRHFIRSIIRRKDDGSFHVRATGAQGSGILRSMSEANGIIVIPEEAEGARAGEKVEVYLIDSEEALSSDGG